MNQYIGATNHVAPKYWCCKHIKKNWQNQNIVVACSQFLPLLVQLAMNIPAINGCCKHHGMMISNDKTVSILGR
jgi:hypothetical protein